MGKTNKLIIKFLWIGGGMQNVTTTISSNVKVTTSKFMKTKTV